MRAAAADVLVVGAGPAGLALALQAHDHGAAVRIVDRRPEADRPSRALILHSRTLEILRPLGVTRALLARADIGPTADLQLGSRVIRVTLADLALPDTAFPHLSLIRQTDAERVLAEALADRGIKVERGTELISVRDGPGGVRAVLRSPAGTEQALFGFVAGCDGPASTVRAQAGIGWPGRTYPVEVVLADAELDGDLADDAARVVAGRRGLVFAFRLGERATWRLLATRTAGSGQSLPGQFGPPVPVAEVQALMDEAGLGAQIAELAWSSRVTLQRRVAGRFGQGRLYLAGDAAHAYSPATGQGMNAGIQDAVNLGWKLAFAAGQPGDGRLLDSYDRERRPVARQVLAMTHLVFWAEASLGPVPSALRGRLAPLAAPLVPAVLGRRRLVAGAVRLLSQLGVNYRHSPLSVEGTPRRPGGPRAGDRLPDQLVSSAGRTIRLHDLLTRPGVHILLDRDADPLGTLRPNRFVSIHRLTSSPGCGLIAVRPDGYIGFRGQIADTGQLAAWLARIRAGNSVTNGARAQGLRTYHDRPWRPPYDSAYEVLPARAAVPVAWFLRGEPGSMNTGSVVLPADRAVVLLRRGRALEGITLGWNVAGMVVLAIAALRARSVALAGFGLDSLIEIGASTVVLWELSGTGEDRQRRALRLIGGAFLVLAAYLAVQSSVVLATGYRPGPSLLGIAWSAVTAAVMFALAAGKARTGTQLGNPVLATEGRVTLVDGILAVAVLAGLALNAGAGAWWADPLAALVIVFYALREARTIFRPGPAGHERG